MSYIKLGLKNAVRSLRYNITLCLIFTLAIALITVTDGARQSGEILKKEITESHTVTVQLVEKPPILMSGKAERVSIEDLTYIDAATACEYPEVKAASYCFSAADNRQPYLWEINFDI